MKKRKLLSEVQLSEKVVFRTFEREDWKLSSDIDTQKEIVLPRISNQKLWELYKQIKPVVKFDEFYYWAMNFKKRELRHDFQPASLFLHKKEDNLIDKSRIEVIDEFDCFHTHHGFRPEHGHTEHGFFLSFCPSVAEVLQQMPDKLLKHTNAFYISKHPETYLRLWSEPKIEDLGCHKSKVQAMVIEK